MAEPRAVPPSEPELAPSSPVPALPAAERVPPAPRRRRRRWVGWLYVLPALVLYGFVVLVPALQSVNYSLYRWDGVTAAVFVGLQNYAAFLTDDELLASIAHIGVLVIFYAVLPIILGLT